MRIVKDRTGPDLDERPVYVSMSPNQAISSDKSIRFSPLAAARPLTIRSWPEALNAKGAKRAYRMAISRNARFFSSVHSSHHFVNQHPEKQVALTLNMGPASDMMIGNALEIVRPRWPKRQLAEVVAQLSKMDDKATSWVFHGTEAARFPESLGFRTGSMSVHTRRAMMLEELGLVLDRVPQIARKGEYELAIVEQNVLGKPTRSTRQRTAQRLSDLYALDPACSVFRLLRIYLSVDPAGRPMLAFLGIE